MNPRASLAIVVVLATLETLVAQARARQDDKPTGATAPEGSPNEARRSLRDPSARVLGRFDELAEEPYRDEATVRELRLRLKNLEGQREQLSQELEVSEKDVNARLARLKAVLPDPESIKPEPFEIPQDPLPHEGAMIDYPSFVEPPDLIVIEVLDALPGRPITGERLVRHDGTVSLDFYGNLHVRGLRPDQVKTKVVLYLRRFLNDETLGLYESDPTTQEIVAVPPSESQRVFVDITSYNHTVYYVEGELAAPGRLPFTGNETLLDAVVFAQGLLPSADPANIRLCRPASAATPRKEYPIDLEAIRRGEKTANLQLFPGDRLVVGTLPQPEANPAAGPAHIP